MSNLWFVAVAMLLSTAALAQDQGQGKQSSGQPAEALPVSVPDSYLIGPEDILGLGRFEPKRRLRRRA